MNYERDFSMGEKRSIDSYFKGLLEDINIILNDEFYNNVDKENFKYVKENIEKWYNDYKRNNTLKVIEPRKLEEIGLEITDFFDKYVVTESVKENYAERLSYDFGKLELYWKSEMLGDEKNGR